MKAYLQQQGAWIMISAIAGIPPPMLNAEGTNCNDMFEWEQMEAKTQGSIKLHLNVEVSHTIQDKTTAKSLWDVLKEVYGSTSTMGAFSFFKAAVGIRLPQSEHPAAAITKINGNLDELSRVGITLPKELQALMILGAAPARYNAAVQMVLSSNQLTAITAQIVQDAIVASWEVSKNSGQSLAQKISAIKQRKGNPSFSQQQRRSEGWG